MTAVGQGALDPEETLHRIADPRSGLSLLLRRLPAAAEEAPPVLYVHGATFPSALSVTYRFDIGTERGSWRDALHAAGYDVWALDFPGYGGSDRWPAMAGPAAAAPPAGDVEAATGQVVLVLARVAATAGRRASIIAHSWGSIPAAGAAAQRPDLLHRLVLFGPIAPRQGGPAPPRMPAWREVSVAQQHARFVADVPDGEPPVLDPGEFAAWGERYLDSDPASRSRTPPTVRVPAGPAHDIARAWGGEWLYDPARILAPVAVLRGEWDSLTTAADAAVLLAAMTAAPERRDVRLARGTHLMHLESGRAALQAASIDVLKGQAGRSSIR